MWPEAAITSPLSFCSLDADGSIYEEEVEIVAKGGETEIDECVKLEANYTCSSKLVSYTRQTIAVESAVHSSCHSVGGPSAATDKAAVVTSDQLPPTLEPALLSHSSSPLEEHNKISTSTSLYSPTLADAASNLTDIDLGSNEEVSNAELHSLELEYQQEQFEENQKKRQDVHYRVTSFDSATLYSVCPGNWSTDTMTTFEPTSSKNKKRIALDKLVVSRKESQKNSPSKSSKEATSSSPPIRPSKIVASSSSSKKTSQSMGNSTRIKDKEEEKSSKRHSISLSKLPSLKTKLDDESAAKIMKAVLDSEEYQKAIEEGHEVSVQIFDDDNNVSIGRCDSRTYSEATTQTVNKRYKKATTQTMNKSYSDQICGTDEKPVIQRCDVESQVAAPCRKDAAMQLEEPPLLKEIATLESFDRSPKDRYRPFMKSKQEMPLTIDLSIIIQPACKEAVPTLCEVAIECNITPQHHACVEANLLLELGKEKGAQTNEEADHMEVVPEAGAQSNILCKNCHLEIMSVAKEDESATFQESSQDDMDDTTAIEQNSDEAQAAIALKSLQCQEMVMSTQKEEEVQEEKEIPVVTEQALIEETDKSDGEEEAVVEDFLAQVDGGEVEQEASSSKSMTYLERADDSACQITQSKKRGGSRRKSQQQKEEEQIVFSRMVEHLPLRRTGRQKQEVDYSEKARREKPVEQKVEDSRAIRSRKRSGEVLDVPQESMQHPKKKWKKSKTDL